MDPWTGEILAMANLPNFDPNRFWKFGDEARRDRAVMDAYEPGSTYKLVTAAAALESHKVTLASRFPAHDRLEVGGQNDSQRGRRIHGGNRAQAKRSSKSSSTRTTSARRKSACRSARRRSTRWNAEPASENPSGLGLPGENPGIVPPPSQWSGSSLATMSFGQGVSVTPLAMARYYCAIANGGLLVAAADRAAPSTTSKASSCSATPPRLPRRVFSRETAAELAQVPSLGRAARHRRPDGADSRLRDGRQDRNRANGRRRRIPIGVTTPRRSSEWSRTRAPATSST